MNCDPDDGVASSQLLHEADGRDDFGEIDVATRPDV